MSMRRKKRKVVTHAANLGAFYTPPVLSEWAGSLLFKLLSQFDEGNIVDPACGDGALLQVVRKSSRRYSLTGLDFDVDAIRKASDNLEGAANLICGDALQPNDEPDILDGWARLLDGREPIGVIANPPWGAHLNQSPAELRGLGFTLAQGQFDSFEIFIELALKITRRGGGIVLIVPDSIFQPEHKPLRALLCSKVRLRLIARLGEGFFDNVYRGTVVLAIENSPPDQYTKVGCMRLNKNWRNSIQDGSHTFEDAEKALVHFVYQSRFQNDLHKRFDIDLSENETPRISLIERHVDGWTGWLTSSRGVELSKSGNVIYCPNCSKAQPQPKSVRLVYCPSCNHRFFSETAKADSIVVKDGRVSSNWKPLIVGEDVDRYLATPSRLIRADVDGINYKSESTFSHRKILVRKTGVGIKAAIDESGALTNQVVFLYRMKRANAPVFLLDYFLGVLCSRVMLAYHLKKRGENEWRSHPYLTQRIISELPVPNIQENTWQWNQAIAIAKAVKQRAASSTLDADLFVERLVAGLFGLDESDCDWVLKVLDDAQALEPIRTLRLSSPTMLKPIIV